MKRSAGTPQAEDDQSALLRLSPLPMHLPSSSDCAVARKSMLCWRRHYLLRGLRSGQIAGRPRFQRLHLRRPALQLPSFLLSYPRPYFVERLGVVRSHGSRRRPRACGCVRARVAGGSEWFWSHGTSVRGTSAAERLSGGERLGWRRGACGRCGLGLGRKDSVESSPGVEIGVVVGITV